MHVRVSVQGHPFKAAAAAFNRDGRHTSQQPCAQPSASILGRQVEVVQVHAPPRQECGLRVDVDGESRRFVIRRPQQSLRRRWVAKQRRPQRLLRRHHLVCQLLVRCQVLNQPQQPRYVLLRDRTYREPWGMKTPLSPSVFVFEAPQPRHSTLGGPLPLRCRSVSLNFNRLERPPEPELPSHPPQAPRY